MEVLQRVRRPLAERGPTAAAATAASAAQCVRGDRPRPSRWPSAVSSRSLFADLVGFTALSESRDAEEVRELLSRYFDTCRRLIELYGGTVEKFIGDAVMAVWGTPVATEDDAERAVRAALDLVAAVSALGHEVGAPELRARAGVLTGEAAVTLGAVGEGMVAGDLVNTASRVQSVAEPGSVFVGEATRRATERAIVYEDAGSHELKGKEGETPLWRALRVVSGCRRLAQVGGPGGAVRRVVTASCGRSRTCSTSAPRSGRAQLVSVTGIAGIGKSRLAWEFYKYFDGLAQIVYWHRGRCLAYGEGVTYWALADMVRMRCRIAEDEQPESALRKLRATLEEHLLDPEERRFVEPRLAQLLGARRAATSRDRQDLFAAWRLFFERLADTYPTVLAFEDMQWADASLLDFVEYLLEWSRDKPLFVVTLARPELLERRPTWGAGHRNFTSLYLEPLLGAGDAGAAGRARARACRRRCVSRSSPAPRASRCTRSRPCGCCSTAACSSRKARVYKLVGEVDDARGARDLARADRRPPRRARARGAAAARRRRRARQDVHAASARRAERSRGRAARGAAHRAGAQGGARAAVRPALARARPVRASSRTSLRHVAYETLRSASGGRSTSLPPSTSPHASARTRSPRSSPRTCSTPTGSTPTRRTPKTLRRTRARGAAARRRTRRLARRRRRGTTLLRAGRRARLRATEEAAALIRAGEMAYAAADTEQRKDSSSSRRSPSTRPPATLMLPRAPRSGSR